jgi:hypothetical protein
MVNQVPCPSKLLYDQRYACIVLSIPIQIPQYFFVQSMVLMNDNLRKEGDHVKSVFVSPPIILKLLAGNDVCAIIYYIIS